MGESVDGQIGEAARLIELAKEKPLTPGQCGRYMRTELAKAFKEITKGFLDEAKKGGCQHVKLATELVKDSKDAAQKKGAATKFFEKWERERPARERLQRERELQEQERIERLIPN